MGLEQVTDFSNYTTELMYVLRGLFAYGELDSRPVRYNNVIMWLDSEQRLHRYLYPAIEREDGTNEHWEHGIKI